MGHASRSPLPIRAQARAERQALAPAGALQEVVRQTQKHRGLSQLVLDGNAQALTQVGQVRKQLESAWTTAGSDLNAQGLASLATSGAALRLQTTKHDPCRECPGWTVRPIAMPTNRLVREELALLYDTVVARSMPDARTQQQLGFVEQSAQQVRTLAQRSGNAAREIRGLSTASAERVAQGTSQAEQAGATMKEIVDATHRVSDIMREISMASAEQASNVDEVSRSVGQMDEAAQRNAALVEESAVATHTLQQRAEALQAIVRAFRVSEPA